MNSAAFAADRVMRLVNCSTLPAPYKTPQAGLQTDTEDTSCRNENGNLPL